MDFFRKTPTFDFLGKAPIAAFLSIIMVGLSVYIWVARGPGKFGIDFRGGYELTVDVAKPIKTTDIQDALEKAGLGGATVQSFEAGSNDYSIRVGLVEGLDAKAVKEKVLAVLKDATGEEAKVLQSDSVGAVIGGEMREQAFLATILGLIGVVIYVAFRFELSFGLGALVALFHDVIVGCGVFLWMGYDLNGAALAAALTIVGYSVNDTIVIFDRVREHMRKQKNADLREMMNLAMNECLSRTIITSGLTLFTVLALYLFGGGAIQDLSLFLLAGMVCGVYSTVYIASPVALAWERFQSRRRKK